MMGNFFLLLFGQYSKMHCAKKPLLAASSTQISIMAGLLVDLQTLHLVELKKQM